MSAEAAQAVLGATGVAWFAIGVGLIKWTKDARGWGVIMLAAGAFLMAVVGAYK